MARKQIEIEISQKFLDWAALFAPKVDKGCFQEADEWESHFTWVRHKPCHANPMAFCIRPYAFDRY